MTQQEQMDYIRQHYKKLTGKFMAKMLGLDPNEVYSMIHSMGLKKQEPAKITSKPKPDVWQNSSDKIQEDVKGKIPLRINARTIILIPEGADPIKRMKEFLEKTNGKSSKSELLKYDLV